MVNIHDLADKTVSLSCNVFVFFRFFLLQLSQTGIIKLSHNNYALTKYNMFCSLHNFILQCNMIFFYKTKLTDKENCKVSEYIKKKNSFSAVSVNQFLVFCVVFCRSLSFFSCPLSFHLILVAPLTSS